MHLQFNVAFVHLAGPRDFHVRQIVDRIVLHFYWLIKMDYCGIDFYLTEILFFGARGTCLFKENIPRMGLFMRGTTRTSLLKHSRPFPNNLPSEKVAKLEKKRRI